MSELVKVISPVDGRVCAQEPLTSKTELGKILEKSRAAGKSWSMMPLEHRAQLCHSAVQWMLAHKDSICESICWQMGRPIQYCGGELNGFSERAQYMIEVAHHKLQAIEVEDSDQFKRFIKREALGCVVAIVPWNYPLLTAVNSVIPALMAGNTVIMKSSSQTPLSGSYLRQAFVAAGLPEGVFQAVLLTHEDTETLVASPYVNFVSFTGSVDGGKAILRAMRENIGSAMELGGKDPAYVRADADLAFSIENLVDGAFFNSGQSCCAVERIYVHETLYEKFLDGFIETVKTYRLADPTDADTTLGPVVNQKAVERIQAHLDQAKKMGAKTCIDVSEFSHPSPLYVAPQVLTEVDHNMLLMREETFGPVVGIMKVDSDEQALKLMNDSDYGLSASVWTNDVERAIVLGEQVSTGTWFMNRCDYLDPALGWTGYKASGRGCSLSEISYEQLSRPKSFHIRKQVNR